MTVRATPTIQNGCLLWNHDGRVHSVPVGAEAWFAWLAQAASFVFVGAEGTFTARKERAQRGGWYWRAYTRRAGKLHRAYLGKLELLTLERLEAAAAVLAQRQRGCTPLPGQAVTRRTGIERFSPRPDEWTFGQSMPLLSTKLTVPRLRSPIVDRGQLMRRLDQGTQRMLTLVSAPTGFGKTTLIGSWAVSAAAQGRLVAWVSLDVGDNDPLRFWVHVVNAFQRSAPGFADQILPMFMSRSQPLDAAIFTLVNALVELRHDITLVLDDYHEIAEPTVHTSLAYLLDHLPPHAHVLLSTRTDPPIPLGRLRALGELLEVRLPDLQFSAGEVGSFLTHVVKLRLPDRDVARLTATTEGWIGAIQVAVLPLAERPEQSRHLAASVGSDRRVMEYLAEEVLAREPLELQRFLMQTSILQRFKASLCDTLTGRDDSVALLEALYRSNMFLTPLDARAGWYRYHHLFAEFLRDRLRRRHPELVEGLHQTAARWFERHAFYDQAIEHAIAGGAHSDVVRLLLDHAEMMFARGEKATLLRSVTSLPAQMLREHPRLGLIYIRASILSGRSDGQTAWLRELDRPEVGISTMQPPRAIDTAMGADRGIEAAQVEQTVLRALIALARGDTTRALAVSEQVMGHVPPDDRLLHGTLALIGRAAATARGNLDPANRHFADLQRTREAGQSASMTLLALSHQAHICAVQGQLQAAMARFRQVLRTVDEAAAAEVPALGMALIGLGNLLYERNDLPQARHYVRQGIDYGRRWSNAELLVRGYTCLARICQAEGDVSLAGTLLEEAAQVARERGASSQAALRLAVGNAWLLLAQGDALAAAGSMHDYERHLSSFLPSLSEHAHVTMAHLNIAQGRFDDALERLARLRSAAEPAGRIGSLIAIRIAEALALQAQGMVMPALQAFHKALIYGASEAYIRSFVDAGAPIVPLLCHTLQHEVEQPYARRLLEACRHLAPVDAQSALDSIRPLSERERQVLQLVATGASNQEIARAMVVTISTVKKHISNILRKLDVHSRTRAVARARQLSLL